MNFQLVFSTALLLALSSTALAAENFGVATTDGNVACVATREPIHSFPRNLEIVVPGTPQRVLSGALTSTLAKPCGVLARAGLYGPFFALQLPPNAKLGPGEIAIASFGSTRGRSFRLCTSSEGVHLSVWAGKALTSKRIWHQYVYLGYDIEPSCTGRDVEG